MTGWFAVGRALPMTFAIYVAQSCLAALAGFPFSMEVNRVAAPGSLPITRAAWLEHVLSWGGAARVAGLTLLLAAALWLLLSPMLQMAWLSALDASESPSRSLARGTSLWLRAALVSLWVGLFSALLALPWLLLAWGLSRLLGTHPNERMHDTVVALSLSPLPLVLAFAHAWSDLARARALREGAFTSVRRSLRSALRLRVHVSFWGWTAASWGAAAAACWGAGRIGSDMLAAQVALLQAGMLLRLCLRARWLTRALRCAEPQ